MVSAEESRARNSIRSRSVMLPCLEKRISIFLVLLGISCDSADHNTVSKMGFRCRENLSREGLESWNTN